MSDRLLANALVRLLQAGEQMQAELEEKAWRKLADSLGRAILRGDKKVDDAHR